MLLVGTCGFPVALDRLGHALDAAEVQRTFYRPPAVATARRWRSRVPPTFRFTVKAWQLITHLPASPTYRRAGLPIAGDDPRYGHFRPTPEVAEAWEATLAVARALGAPVVLFQGPPSFRPTEENLGNLEAFVARLPRDLRYAWEPRGPWPPGLVAELCRRLGLLPAFDPFAGRPVAGGAAYLRLHGKPPGRRMYHHAYADEELAWLAGVAREYEEAWVMFNNDRMWEDAQRFRRLVAPPGRRAGSPRRASRP